ncbi:hypothetical protein PVAND_011886 [Polypedilum vanderplanki]|uniref:Short-chain dehydrogenase/reductase 3 n=1 Tax=Polypedilum vanderplanki TaxID=319348 RepID=A0A9J6CLL7_POLVA|nr:hypothetical protein PVAND_011886 [Polypedilum vanderplanki]
MHLNFVTSHDDGRERVKLVTLFIDSYNRYSGFLMVGILVLIGYFQQAKNTEIFEVFLEIEKIFLKNLKVRIQNVKTLRIVYLQITIICGAIIFTEYNNCLMYIQPTSSSVLQENCLLLCILPMLIISIVECRIFAYFLLIRERFKIINKLINFYRENINNSSKKHVKNIFFISDFSLPSHLKGNKLLIIQKMSFKTKLNNSLQNFYKFIKSLFDFRLNCHDIEDINKNSVVLNINFIDRIMAIQIIYSKLHKIFNLINLAYGIQIIGIIAVQFITLTTLMYYFTMKLVRSEFDPIAVLTFLFDLILLIVKFILVTIEAFFEWIFAKEENVQGEIVLITGAGHGIGKEIAIQYAALGAKVVCWDINEETNKHTVNTIKSNGGEAFGYTVDITNKEKVQEIGKKVLEEVGAVTILVNNAGIMPQHDLLDHTEKVIRRIFDINVLAHFWTIQTFLPKMIENNKGHIVGISSMAGLLGFQNLVPYCSSKHAIRGIHEGLLDELLMKYKGNCKIKFTMIFPYMVDTGLFKKASIRFEKLMPIIKPKNAAAAIISAQRKSLHEASIPRFLFHFQRYLRIFPNKSALLVKSFLEVNIEADDES